MIEYTLKVENPELVEAYAYLSEHVPDFVNASVNRSFNKNADGLRADLRAEPGPLQTPVNWTSPRQKRFVMAAKREGRIKTPFVRDGANGVAASWDVSVVYIPDELTQVVAENDNPATRFVEGLDQQQWHAQTGWIYYPDVIDLWAEIIRDDTETDLVKSFYAIGDEHGR